MFNNGKKFNDLCACVCINHPEQDLIKDDFIGQGYCTACDNFNLSDEYNACTFCTVMFNALINAHKQNKTPAAVSEDLLLTEKHFREHVSWNSFTQASHDPADYPIFCDVKQCWGIAAYKKHDRQDNSLFLCTGHYENLGKEHV